MESPNKINATSNLNSEFQIRMSSSNENGGHSRRRGFGTISQVPKKKILAERNIYDDAPLELETIPIVKPIICSSEYIPLSSRVRSSDPTPYDPVNNFTSPRPKFLRYNPNRRIEILHRMEQHETTDGEGSSSSPPDQGKEGEGEEVVGEESLEENFQQVEEDGSDAEVDDAREEEERRWSSRMVWKLLFLIGLFLFSRHYLFPMTSSSSTPPSPPLQDNGGSREITPQGPRNLLLITHMGLSDMCLDVEGLMICSIDEEDHRSSSSFLGEILAIGEPQVVNNDLVTSDEVNSEEEDLYYYGIEERDEEKLAEEDSSSSTMGYESEEKVDLLCILNNLFSSEEEEEHDVLQREEEESRAEVMVNTDYDIHPSEDEIYSGDKTEAEESAYLTAAPLSALAPFPLVDDQGADQIEWARHLAIFMARARPLCRVPMKNLLLAAALSGVSVCIFRHVLNLLKAKLVLPRSKSLGKKRFKASVTVGSDEKRFKPVVIKEFGDESGGASYATRPPTVQLLGEFSFAEPTVSKIGAGQSSKGTEPEESQLSQYQSEKQFEDSQISQYYVRSATKNVSCSASKVHPSTASTVDASQEKLPRTEDSGTTSTRGEVKMILATPLRRSDRLRNRATTPPPPPPPP